VRRNLPMTLITAFTAMLIAAFVGILLGTLAGVYENRFADRMVLFFSTLGVTLPAFVLAPLLVGIFANRHVLDLLPQDWESELRGPAYMYLILPVAILAARPAALLTRLTRASLIDTFQQEFIRTAVAKGVPRGRLIFRHALRNAILPVITAIGTSFGFLLTGSFVIERYFRLPGIGREAIEAIQRQDTPVIQACILLTGVMFIVVNLVVDILLPILDPRIREAQV
jgi:peptide/nickel transport system permease protein